LRGICYEFDEGVKGFGVVKEFSFEAVVSFLLWGLGGFSLGF